MSLRNGSPFLVILAPTSVILGLDPRIYKGDVVIQGTVLIGKTIFLDGHTSFAGSP